VISRWQELETALQRGFLARVEHPHREPAGAKGKLADTIARIARTSRHVEAAHDREVDIPLLSDLRVRSRHRQSRRGRDRKVGVNDSEPTIRATCTSARLVRRATQGTGAHGPNEFGRAVGRSHLSSVHLHDYSCQSMDSIDCHNNQEE
jgi:hypothetical protein